MEKIPISLSRNYVSDWGVEEAIRELIQNCLDQDDHEIYVSGSSLTINSYGASIPNEYLLLGNGGKSRDDDNRGGFNEGLKLALLIFAREEVDITFNNAGVVWTPVIEYSELYKTECLHIIQEDTCVYKDSVEIEINGIHKSVIDNVISNTRCLQPQTNNVHVTSKGEILLDEDHKGKVYCGGLFVDYFKSDYGFDFHPKYFDLDRDRKSLKPFDVQWQCKDLWGEVAAQDTEETAEEIVSGLQRGENSLEFTNYTLPKNESLNKAAEKVYTEQYSGKLVTSSHEEFNELKSAGNEVEFVKSEGLVNLIRKTSSYQVVFEGKLSKKTPSELLEDFKDKWYDEFSSEMLFDFEDMQSEIEK